MSPARGTATTKPCAECGWEMRPYGSLAEVWPGTHARGARGLCISCYERAHRKSRGNGGRRVSRVPTPPPTPVPESAAPVAPAPAPVRRAAAGSDDPCVLVRTDLRPSTYKRIADAARARGVAPGELLSRIADAAVRGEKP